MYYPVGQKFARNRSISYGFHDIHTISLSANIQDGHQKWIVLNYPVGQNFAQNRSISYHLRDIFNVLFSAEIQDGRQKWRKLKFFPSV